MSAELPTPSKAPAHTSRAVHLLLAGLIAVAFVGFFVGIRQGKTVPDLSPPQREVLAEYPQAIPATAWRDVDRRRYGPNHEWHSSLASLQQPPVDYSTPPRATSEDRRALQFVRATRRAFPGAPPVVPHPVDQMSVSSCMVCHGEGLFIGKGVRAPRMSHALFASCTQCHVESGSAELPSAVAVENDFQAVESPLAGRRAWPGAPPVIPHTTWMREKCISCHGPTGKAAIRTTHPTRANCLQCHVSSAVLDQLVVEDEPAWLAESEARSAKP